MKNTYQLQVGAQCPVNDSDTDIYEFTIESNEIIEVEKIVAFFQKHAKNKGVFQETLTQEASVILGARVTSVGIHSNVTVICRC